MIERTNQALVFDAFFRASGIGATGLTVTVDVYEETGTKIVNGSAATEIGGGLYTYTLAAGSNDAAGNYRAIFKTAGTADEKHIVALLRSGAAGVNNLDATISSRPSGTDWTSARAALLPNLNTTVSSRLAASSYSAPPSTADWTSARAAKLDNLDATVSSRSSHAAPDLSKLDANVSSRASAADWTTARAAKIDQLDAAVTSRASAADLTSARAAKLDNLDALVSSRSSHPAPDLSKLDVNVSTRLAASGYTAPPDISGLATSAQLAAVATSLAASIAALPSTAAITAILDAIASLPNDADIATVLAAIDQVASGELDPDDFATAVLDASTLGRPAGSLGAAADRVRTSNAVIVANPVDPTSHLLTLTKGNTYTGGRAPIWSDAGNWPSLVGATVELVTSYGLTVTGVVSGAGGSSQSVSTPIASVEATSQLRARSLGTYDLRASWPDGRRETLESARSVLRESIA